MTKREYVRLEIKPGEERRIKAGHHWIFSNELVKVDKTVEPGSMCEVFNSKGEKIGTGYFNPNTLIAVRLLKKRGRLEEDFIIKRLRKAYDYRKDMGYGNFCRLCNGEADGLDGLIIDRFGDYFSVDILTAGMDKLEPEIEKALTDLFEPKGIYFRNSSSFREMEGLNIKPRMVGKVPEDVTVEQNGVKYEIPFIKGQKTGFYYDQSDNRDFLTPFFKNRIVLDLYCYVGSFAVKAAVSGAEEVYGVDSSQLAIDYAAMNAKINKVGDIVKFQKEDSERALSYLRAGDFPVVPDMVILDPPNYVKSRKNFSQAKKHYIKMLEMAMEGVADDGLIVFSTCSHHILRETFIEIIRAASVNAEREVTLVELRGQAKDHPIMISMPETEYLHFALLHVK